jgi:hypothetical protein
METNSSLKWTDDDDRRLLELKTEGKSSRQIALTLMRSVSAIEQRFYILRRRQSPDETQPSVSSLLTFARGEQC